MLGGFIRKQGELILQNELYALLYTITFVLLPYTGWLAASVIALVTLRKGMKAGGLLLVPAIIAHGILLKTKLSMDGVIIGCVLSNLPCYFAASVLRVTQSWRAVSCMLFFLVLLVMSMLQIAAPEFIIHQFLYLKEILNQLQLGNTFSVLNQHTNTIEQSVLANYLVGIQAVGVATATFISLMFARYVQSRIYYPEGFKLEMRGFRANKIDLLVLLVTWFAARQYYSLAIDMLPILIFFFFMIGLSLWLDCMTLQRGMFVPLLILSVVMGFYPHILLPVYVLIGVLDTLVNIRLHLNTRSSKTIRGVK